MQASSVYREVRTGLSALVEGCSADDLATTVPTCPDWTVQDTLAHLAGVAADLVAGNVAGAGSEPWTAAQVEERRGRAIAAILYEWVDQGSRLESELLSNVPPSAQAAIVGDAIAHSHDIRVTLGRGGQDVDQIDLGLQALVGFLNGRLRAKGAPPLTLEAGSEEWTVGDGLPDLTLRAEPFELLRVLTGRRSRSQVESLSWSSPPPAVLVDALAQYPYSAEDVRD